MATLKEASKAQDTFSVSIIIPCRNEAGTIAQIVDRMPQMGSFTELIFIEGHSQDGTLETLHRVATARSDKRIRILQQTGIGKRNATVEGCDAAQGDIIMIFDADMTVDPEALPLFYTAIAEGWGRLINGTRLRLPMERKAMQWLNWIANHGFAWIFSWILKQKLTDTLCGTKVFWRTDYETMIQNSTFWKTDPFGDFALLLGIAQLGGTIYEVPVSYRARRYGRTQIRRFYHGVILLGLTLRAWRDYRIKNP